MKILYITQWFDPEPILKGRAFAGALSGLGNEVEVVTGFPSYPLGEFYPGWSPVPFVTGEEDGLTVHRVLSYPSRDDSVFRRALTYLSFAVMATLRVIGGLRGWNVVYVYHPPISVVVPALVAARLSGAPLVLDVQDLWPDTLRATSMVGGGRVYRIIGRVCDFLYRRADRIIVLSDGFRDSLVERGVPRSRVRVIRNWSRFDSGAAAEEFAPPSGRGVDPPSPGEGSGAPREFEILYAGAVGPAQELDVVLDAAERVRESVPQVVFRILGEGIEKDRLQRAAAERGLINVEFLPGVDVDAARDRMGRADCLLIHLRPDPLFEITIPSKIQDCLSLGRPIVAGVSGEARRLLTASAAAVLFDPGDAAGLARAVLELERRSANELRGISKRARDYYSRTMSFARGIQETRTVVDEAVAARRSGGS